MAKSDYRAAIVQLKNAIQAAPDNGDARLLLARSLLESGEPVNAATGNMAWAGAFAAKLKAKKNKA